MPELAYSSTIDISLLKPLARQFRRRVSLKVTENFFCVRGHMIKLTITCLGEIQFISMLEEGEQRIVESVGVDEHDGLLVILQLFQSNGLGDLFEGAESAGESYEGVGMAFHFEFASGHIVRDNDLVTTFPCNAASVHGVWNHADHFTACGFRGAGYGAHKPDFASSEDEGEAARADSLPQRLSGGHEFGSDGVAGGAIYADSFHGHG